MLHGEGNTILQEAILGASQRLLLYMTKRCATAKCAAASVIRRPLDCISELKILCRKSTLCEPALSTEYHRS